MDVEQLNALSYKELQAHAKQLNIAANQKKEILVQEILALGGANDENSAVAANKVVINVPASVTKAPVTPVVNRSVRVTRSTAKKALVVEESSDEVIVAPASAPMVDVDDSKVEASSPQAQTPMDAKPILPMSTGKKTLCFAEQLEMGPCESYNEDNEEDEEYPNPTTLFEAEDELEQNLSALEISTTPTPKAPVNKHVYFTSPELSMGNGVHWNYEDYSKEEQAGEKDDEEDTRSEASAESEAEETSQPARMKLPAGHGDRVMNFWLTKAFAMPPLNYFK